MISAQETYDVAVRLLERTRADALNWLPNGGNSFRCSFPKSSVVIEQVRSGGVITFNVLLINNNGDIVGKCSVRPASDAFSTLQELYTSAERKALSIDETLRDILSNLD